MNYMEGAHQAFFTCIYTSSEFWQSIVCAAIIRRLLAVHFDLRRECIPYMEGSEHKHLSYKEDIEV